MVENAKGLTSSVAGDIDGDGRVEVVVGGVGVLFCWYRPKTLEKGTIDTDVTIYVGMALQDLDVDGHPGLVVGYTTEGSVLVWYKPERGDWQLHCIGKSAGDWPHGTLIAPVLPGGGLAPIATYHSANSGQADYPEIFEIPADPAAGPWKKRTIAPLIYNEMRKTPSRESGGVQMFESLKEALQNSEIL